MALRAGRLNKRILIEAPVQVRGPGGGVVTGYVPFDEAWASLEPFVGREYHAAGQSQSEATTRIRLRWREGVTAAHRVRYKDRVFEIVSPPINVYEADEEMQLMVKETTEGA